MDGVEKQRKTAREWGRFGGHLAVDNCVLSLPEKKTPALQCRQAQAWRDENWTNSAAANAVVSSTVLAQPEQSRKNATATASVARRHRGND
jgi:hypothetical protein